MCIYIYTYMYIYIYIYIYLYIYVYVSVYVCMYVRGHSLLTLGCLEDETPHEQGVNKSFQSENVQKNPERSLHVGTTKK